MLVRTSFTMYQKSCPGAERWFGHLDLLGITGIDDLLTKFIQYNS